MTQADRVHSTPPTDTTTNRRGFLSQAAGAAVGAAALALAPLSPRPALAAPALAVDATSASPALRAAARALDEAHELVKVARARTDDADDDLATFEESNPEPEGRTARKRWGRTWREKDIARCDAWVAQIEAEKHFQAAQSAVALIDVRDLGELAAKACLAGVYDAVLLQGVSNCAVIGYSVALNLVSLTRLAS